MFDYTRHLLRGIWRGFREGDRLHTIRDDFHDHHDYSHDHDGLTVYTPFGPLFLPGDYEYDRFTGVYDTDCRDFWIAAACHDWGCEHDYKLHDVNGQPVIVGRILVEIVFWDKMLTAARYALVSALHSQEHSPERILRENRWMIKRALRYLRGVQLFGPRD